MGPPSEHSCQGMRATGEQRMMSPGDAPTNVVRTAGQDIQPRAELIAGVHLAPGTASPQEGVATR